MVATWAVVTTHNRHEELGNLLGDLPLERTVVIDHRSTVPVDRDDVCVIRDDGPANISRLWNLGLDEVDRRAGAVYDVAVLNDDLRIPARTLRQLSNTLRTWNCAIAFPDVHGSLSPGHVDILKKPGPHNLFYRMTGYCFMMRGELNIRADENLVWWYGDDDIEWRAATMGGVARVGGVTVEHLHPNGSTAANAEQTGIDRQTFIKKWGKPPW